MNTVDEDDMQLEGPRVPLRYPYTDMGHPHHFNRCLFYSAFTMTFISMSLLIAITAVVTPLTSHVSEILTDSRETLRDLDTVMPEIKEGLMILKDFCHIPDFQKYCYPHVME